MEQRARFHPHATDGIKEAQKIYADFIEEMKEKTKAMRNPSKPSLDYEVYGPEITDSETASPRYFMVLHRDGVEIAYMHFDFATRGEDPLFDQFFETHNLDEYDRLTFVDRLEVAEEYRGMGYGTAIMREFMKGVGYLPSIAYAMSIEDSNIPSEQLAKPYKSVGYKEHDLSTQLLRKKGYDLVSLLYLPKPHPRRNPSKTPEGRKIPKRYLKGLNKEEMAIAAKEIDKGYKYDIDDPKAYEYWKSDIKATARGYKTVPSKYKKKFIEMYGPLPEEGKFLDKMAKATKIKKSILEKVYDKGLAAWRGGHRPGVQQHQWAAGRVYSFVTLGNTVMKGKKKMPDHSLAVEAGLIKENPSKGWNLTMKDVNILGAAYRDYNTVIIGKKALKFERFGTVKIPTSFDEVETPSDIVTSAIRKKNFFSEDYFPMFFNSDLSALTAMKMQAGDNSIRIKNGYNSSGWRTWAEPIINTTAYHLIERQDIFDLMLDIDFADTDYKVSQICKNKDGFYLWDGKRRIPFDSVSYAKLLGEKGQFNIKHSSGNDKIFDLTIGLLWVKDSLKVVAISFNKDKKNPGWRHGEQMEDDPFAEYFEENVEGDENVS